MAVPGEGIDQDHHIGPLLIEMFLDSPEQFEIKRDLGYGMGEHGTAADDIFEDAAAGLGHTGAAETFTAGVGELVANLANQSGSVHIAAGFGGTDEYGAYLFLQAIPRYVVKTERILTSPGLK